MSEAKHLAKLKKYIQESTPKVQSKTTKDFGSLGESIAWEFLQENGYKPIVRNWRCRLGEIDIVAVKENTLCFVEVKTRWSLRYGQPEEAVTPRKINKIKKVAQYFSLSHPALPKKLAIIVIAIEIREGEVISKKLIQV